MTKLSISKKYVLARYREGDSDEQQLLEELFGSEIFNSKVTDRVKTLEDAFDETGRPETPEFNDAPEDMREWFQSLYNAAVFNEALNEGWKTNYNDVNKRKWFPWFKKRDNSDFDFAGTTHYNEMPPRAGDSFRLCLKDESLAMYSGKQIIEVYKSIMTK